MAIKSFTRSTIENNIFYRSMLAGNTAFQPASEDILAEEVLTSSQASVTFSSLDTLAADYKHLQIRAVARSNRTGATQDALYMTFNSDTGSSYARHYIRGDGSIVSSGATTSTTSIQPMVLPAGNDTATNAFETAVIDILDFSSSSKNTTARILSGKAGDIKSVYLWSGLWVNTNAVTSITLTASAGQMITNSRFSLYGIKGA